MKRKIKLKILMITIFMFVFSNICYGKMNNYIVTDRYVFETRNYASTNAYVEIFLGDVNCTSYQTGVTTISPKPTTYKFDDFGNRIAVYNLAGYNKSEFVVNVKRELYTEKYNLPQKENNMIYDVEKIYLKPSQYIESDSPQIIQKANELTSNIHGDYNKAKAIFEYVNYNMTYDISPQYRNKGALSALQTKRGVCEDYVTLYIALCRASGIPARGITGFLAESVNLGTTVDATNIYHTWAEVYLQGYGWVPLEVTAEKTVNGNKVIFEEGFLNLVGPYYAVEGMYNKKISEVKWLNFNFNGFDKKIQFLGTVYFTDINSHWAKTYIEKAYDKKVVNGYEDGSFKPNNNITRIEFMVMLSRFLEQKDLPYLNTNDIYYSPDFINNWAKKEYDELMRYYAYFVDKNANSAGFTTINYVFGDNINMNKNITREEVVALMYPFFVYNNNNSNIVFSDIEESRFQEEIELLTDCKIINGYEDNTFKPKNNITRAEVATMFSKVR